MTTDRVTTDRLTTDTAAISIGRSISPPPVGVVDIGSNSVRLVVFDGLRRVSIPLFNEKVLCGLGAGLQRSGRLNPEGVTLALETLARFVGLAKAMRVQDLELLATAAVRDADDGDDFVRKAEALTGRRIQVLTGEEEAQLAAQGVLSGRPESSGAMGDLGGGSLELVELAGGGTGRWASLRLGPLHLMDSVGDDLRAAKRLIDEQLATLPWLESLRGGDFHAVGGAWRALAQIQMQQSRYPLHMVQGYAVERAEAEQIASLVARMGRHSLRQLADVPTRRAATLPHAGLLLARILKRFRPQRVVFSSRGLREGWLFSHLSPAEQERDPLLVAATDWAMTDRRFGDLGEEIERWASPLFGQEEAARRIRLATCHLSDIGWRYHPDYRAEQTLLRVLRAQELYVEHPDRAFMGLALYHRYGGEKNKKILKAPLSILPRDRAREAEVLGRALRVAYLLSGGAPEMLRRSRLELDGSGLLLYVPDKAPIPPGKTIQKRLKSIAASLKLEESRVVIDGGVKAAAER